MNENALAHLKFGLCKKSVVRCDESFGDGCGFSPIQIGRNRRERAFGHKYIFSLCPASRDAEDALARAKGARFASHLYNFARELKAGNVLHCSRRSRVITFAL